MGYSIGFFIQVATFPGVIIHEFSHKLFCDFFKVRVIEVKYFQFRNPMGYVIHAPPNTYFKTFFICTAPLFIGTILSVLSFIFAQKAHSEYVNDLFLWLGISIAANAFPSRIDADILWRATLSEYKANIWTIVGFPVSALIYLINLLNYFCLNIIYGILLFSLTKNLIE
jgi:hypothetical protein